ncbi:MULTISPECIES: 5'-nucleotidase [unclassified Streptomyces]|uniref:5'-nucleotidase n=1 Tax=unclassified Streptomyces TaxID=2593676 RepID=UPI0037FDA995
MAVTAFSAALAFGALGVGGDISWDSGSDRSAVQEAKPLGDISWSAPKPGDISWAASQGDPGWDMASVDAAPAAVSADTNA